jgi:hypothetical protein
MAMSSNTLLRLNQAGYAFAALYVASAAAVGTAVLFDGMGVTRVVSAMLAVVLWGAIILFAGKHPPK